MAKNPDRRPPTADSRALPTAKERTSRPHPTAADDDAAEISGEELTVASEVSGEELTVASEVTGEERTVAAEISGDDRTVAAQVSGVEQTLPASHPGSGSEPPPPAGAGADIEGLVTVPREHYSEGAEFARGGMGRVLAARDRRLGRPVALKELLAQRSELRLRFEREARITGRLQHPSIVPIYEHGRWPSGEPFYAMKHITGRPLSDLLGEARTTEDRLALLPKVAAVAEAIAYAHSLRIIHRDLKPQNVLVGDYGETVVIDWGLAKELDAEPEAAAEAPADSVSVSGDLTLVGAVMGTPAYMPPEQARGETVDERADVYALGAILYACLGGEPPYSGKTSDNVIAKLLAGPPPRLAEGHPDLPPDLLSIVDKAMEPDPPDRYATADALATDLRRYERGQLVGAHHYGGGALLLRWVRRNRLAVGIAALFLLVLAIGGAISVSRIMSARDRAEAERARAIQASAQAKRNEAKARSYAAEADARLASFFVDEGRRELLALHPDRALAFLAEARRLGHRSLALRILLARVERLAGPRLHQIPAHGSPIEVVAFAPDGRSVLTADINGWFKRWNLRDGTLASMHVFVGSPYRFSPDRRYLLVGPASGPQLALLDTKTGRRVRVFRGLRESVVAVAYSPDGRFIAAETTTGTVQVWAAASGAPHGTIEAARSGPSPGRGMPGPGAKRKPRPAPRPATPPSAKQPGPSPTAGDPIDVAPKQRNFLFATAFSPDGNRIALATPAFGAQIRGAANGRKIARTVGTHQKPVVQVSFSPDGTLLLTASEDGEAKVWDARSGELRRTIRAHRQITAARLAPRGNRLVTGGFSGRVKLWDARSGERLALLEGHRYGITRFVFSADGRLLLTIGNDLVARLWEVDTGSFLAAFRGGFPAGAFSASGDRVATAGHDRVLRLWNSRLPRIRHAVPERAERALLDRSGRRAAFIGPRGAVWMRAADPGAAATPIEPVGAPVTAAALSERGDYLAVARGKTVAVWDVHHKRQISRLQGHKEDVVALRFSPRGDRLLSGSLDETGRLWDVRTGRQLVALPGHANAVDRLAFSPDGELVATTSDDALARIWRADSGVIVAAVGTGRRIVGLDFSAGGEQLVTIAEGLQITTWRTTDGAMQSSIEGQAQRFTWLSLAAGGTLIFSSSPGRSTLWDARTGKLLEQFHEGGHGAISGDGKRIVTLDKKRGTATVRVVPHRRVADAELARLVAQSSWRVKKRRLVRHERTPGWLYDERLAAPPPRRPLIDDPAMGLRVAAIPRWGVAIDEKSYTLERRFGHRGRLRVYLSLRRTELEGNRARFLQKIQRQELQIKYAVISEWGRWGGRPAAWLRGPQVSGRPAKRWLVLPRGKHPLAILLEVDGLAWTSPELRGALAALESAMTFSPVQVPRAGGGPFPIGGGLAHVRLEPGWRLDRYGPGAQATFIGPRDVKGSVMVLGRYGRVWCGNDRYPPSDPSDALGGRWTQRVSCPDDKEDQRFHTLRIRGNLVYVGLTDPATKALSGPVTRFLGMLSFPAAKR